MERLKLRGRIVERYGTIKVFAETIGITPTTASNVLAGRTTPTKRMLPVWCGALGIEPEDTGIFFTLKPQKTKEA